MAAIDSKTKDQALGTLEREADAARQKLLEQKKPEVAPGGTPVTNAPGTGPGATNLPRPTR